MCCSSSAFCSICQILLMAGHSYSLYTVHRPLLGTPIMWITPVPLHLNSPSVLYVCSSCTCFLMAVVFVFGNISPYKLRIGLHCLRRTEVKLRRRRSKQISQIFCETNTKRNLHILKRDRIETKCSQPILDGFWFFFFV